MGFSYCGVRYTTTSGTRKKPASRAAADQASSPRLRGTRYSAQPRMPAPWLLPFTSKGNLATVTIHHGGIHIDRTAAGRLNGNHSADIAWRELVGIDFLEPNFVRYGHVHFATSGDPRGLTCTGNGNPMAASPRNPNAIMFTWHQVKAYRQLRDLLTGNVPTRAAAMTTAAPGWYPDNSNPAIVRWWDGTRWTEHTQPAQTPPELTHS